MHIEILMEFNGYNLTLVAMQIDVPGSQLYAAHARYTHVQSFAEKKYINSS